MQPFAWRNFFVATAGASGALTGLLFVGVSINLTRVLALRGLPERALISPAVLYLRSTAKTFIGCQDSL